MLATIGWSRRGASEVKLYSPEDNNNDKNNNNGMIGYAEASCSSSSSNGEKNSKIQSNEINCVEWSKSNGNCVAVGLSDGRVVVLDKQLKCVGEVKEEERKRQRFKRENDDHAEKEKMHKNTPLTFAAENPARDEDVDDDDFEVKSMDFHSSSRYLLVGGTSNIVKVWDLKTRRVTSRLLSSGGISGGGRRSASTTIGGVVNAVKFSKDDRVIACGSERGEIVLHKGGERFGEEEEEESFGLGRGKEFNKYYSEPLSAFDVNEEKSMMSTSSSSSSSVKCLDFSPHRRMMLAAGTSRGDLNVYDCESESLETSFHSSDANNVIHSIAFSPTAPRIIAVANDDGSVSLRDVAMHPKTGVCLHIPNPNKRWMQSSSENGVIFGTAGAASSVSWHPSGQALAVGYRGNGVVSMYDCRSLRTHMDERSNKYRSTRMNGFSNSTSGGAEFYSGDDFETRCLFETEAHEGGRVIGLKWQPPATKAKTKTTNEENDSDKENRIESNVPRKQEQKRHLNKQEEERATAEEMRKSLESLNTTTTTQEQQQQQVLITADAISDEVSKRTKDVVKTCLEKEVKSLKADVRNLHLELLRAQEENATMFRKLHEQHLELMDALSSSNYSSKINGKY